MIFNISKRLLTSDFTLSEINIMIEDLSKHNLYPVKKYKGEKKLRKYRKRKEKLIKETIINI